MEKPRFSSTELTAQAQARRVAREQLLRVPWPQFRRAYEEYPRWHGLWLWVDAMGRTNGAQHSTMLNLKKHAPEFLSIGAQSRMSEPLSLALLDWVHTKRFRRAKQQGWLNALTFYGVRHSYSRGAWLYWEHCEQKWRNENLAMSPNFEEWWGSALDWHMPDQISSLTLAAAVNRYLEWESLKYWLRPLFLRLSEIEPGIRRTLRRYCPGIPHIELTDLCTSGTRHDIWKEVERDGDRRLLLPARQGHWVDHLIEHVRWHPWRARMQAYASTWSRESTQVSVNLCPSFADWKHAAAFYTKSRSGGRKSRGCTETGKPPA